MSHYKKVFNKGKLAGAKNSKKTQFSGVTREELDAAMADYIRKGGKIKRVETEWIEEGEINVLR